MVGFRGSWTKATRDLAMRIPLSDLLLETDAPFMVPNLPPDVPKHSVPGMALCVAQSIAELRSNRDLSDGATLKDIVLATMANTCRMYGINL